MTLVRAVALGALLAAPAQAQSADTRWNAWHGCWESNEADSTGALPGPSAELVCVLPGPWIEAVEVVTVDSGEVVARDTITADGQRVRSRHGTCDGWESAEWSESGTRVYLRSEHTCPGGVVRATSGLLAITGDGDWIDVRGLSSAGRNGVRVLRYRDVSLSDATGRVPAEIITALEGRIDAPARRGAGQWLRVEDVMETSQRMDPVVVQAWLVETGQGFGLGARDLVRLADAGVPSSVTDLMVALSYRRYFVVDRGARAAYSRPDSTDTESPRHPPVYSVWDPWGVGDYGVYGGYSPGWYPGNVVILSGDFPEVGQKSGGRVVNGKGYEKKKSAETSSTSSTSDRPRESGSTTSASSSTSTSSSSSSTSTSSSSGRTAKPRDP